MPRPSDPLPEPNRTGATREADRSAMRHSRRTGWIVIGGLVVSILLVAGFFLSRDADESADTAGGDPAAAVEDAPDPGAETTAPTTAEENPVGDPAPEADPSTGEPEPAAEPAPEPEPAEQPEPADTEPPPAEPQTEPDEAGADVPAD